MTLLKMIYLIDELVNRNDYLSSIENIKNKMAVMFEKEAIAGTKHFILRCDPEVKGQIFKHHDQVNLPFGHYKVRDYSTTCYYCQAFGHTSEKFPHKDKDMEIFTVESVQVSIDQVNAIILVGINV